MLEDKSFLENFNLVEKISNQTAEIISGGRLNARLMENALNEREAERLDKIEREEGPLRFTSTSTWKCWWQGQYAPVPPGVDQSTVIFMGSECTELAGKVGGELKTRWECTPLLCGLETRFF